MIILLDNIINNYLNIFSLLILITIYNMNNNKKVTLLLFDIILNKIPYISVLTIILSYINKTIFKKISNNKVNKIILLVIYYLLFITIIYFIQSYNMDYFYFLKYNIPSFIFNTFIYIVYIFYKY